MGLGSLAHRRPVPALVAAIVVCEVVGASGAVFTAQGLEAWYPSLTKPWFTPPNGVFGPVWTLLFGLMGAAAWLVWRRYPERPGVARTALLLFGAQFVLNVAWSAAFFGARSPSSASRSSRLSSSLSPPPSRRSTGWTGGPPCSCCPTSPGPRSPRS